MASVEVTEINVSLILSETSQGLVVSQPPVTEITVNKEVTNVIIQEITSENIEVKEEVTTVVVSTVGTQGPKGEAGSGAWVAGSSSVSVLSSNIIDTLPLNSFNSLTHIITIFNESENVYRSFRLTTIKKNAILETVISDRVGGLTSVEIDSIVNASNAEIKITNNNNYNLSVTFAKLIL